MAEFVSTLAYPAGRVFISYLVRDADRALYNYSTGSFDEGVFLSDLQGAAREPYRIPYEERAPGSYSWQLTTDTLQSGDYSYQSRELSNEVEYDNVKVETFKVIEGAVQSSDVDLRIETLPGLTLFIYLKQLSTGLFFKEADSSFSYLDLSGAAVAVREPYRIAYRENTPGEYSLTLDANLFDNGNYEVFTYQLSNNVELQAGLPAVIQIQDNREQVGVIFDTVAISESTGGEDNLRYITSANQGVSGAKVVVYLAADYDQGNFDSPFGSTLTRPDGRWTDPIRVPAGRTYKVTFQKEGHYGPDVQEVVV